jgi:hypothetical protein
MKHLFFSLLLLSLVLISCNDHKYKNNSGIFPDKLYEYSGQIEPRWFSFENITGAKGEGGKENNGAKGHPCDYIKPGETKTLLDMQEAGIINRIWITINDRSPEMLRSLRLEMFWDNEKKPAVSVPLGDFFGVGLGETATFENALFANPEGRSFNCFVPMPFKKAARITVTNESGKNLDMIFFDINVQRLNSWDDNFLYFHAYWHRDTATTLSRDYEILPEIKGKGRFLGSNIGILCNKNYKGFWWGEGEVKMYLDGDKEFPTLAGSGTEDYIGTAWGQGKFNQTYTGCLVADEERNAWAFYRFHILDPVYFKNDCRVTIQQIGGGPKAEVKKLMDKGVKLIPVTIHEIPILHPIYKKDSINRLENTSLPEGWVNFYRTDDYSSVAYFYLDSPVNELPGIQGVGIRIFNLQNRMPSGQ